MAVDRIQEPHEGRAAVQILTRVNLEAEIDAGFVEAIQDLPPQPAGPNPSETMPQNMAASSA